MMVRIFAAVGREVRGMHEAAYLLASFALASQFLGLLRDRLLAGTFGASHTLDIYYAAFRVPDFLFATVATLLSVYALLPVLSRLEAEHPGRMFAFLRDALWIFFAAMGVISAVVFFFVPELATLVAPGITGAARGDLILLMRILLLQPVLLGASNTIATLTQLRHRFLLYSISPLLYNLGIIFGAVALYPHFGLAGLGWGVIIGAFLHLAIQAPYFFAEKSSARLPLALVLRQVYQVLALSIPRTLALASNQISLLILIALASLLSPGSIAVFIFAYNLQSVPLTIIGVSYSVAAFPTLARLHAAQKHGEFASHVEAALRHMVFWAVPATVFVIVLRAQLVRVILGTGAFDWVATRLTSAALALFVVSLLAQSLTLLIARAYYAAGNSRKPLYWGLCDVFASVASGVFFVALFHESPFIRAFVESLLRVADVPGTTVLMLALGYTVGAVAEAGISYFFFIRDFSFPRARLTKLFFQSFAASVIGGGVAYGVLFLSGGIGTIQNTLPLMLEGFAAGVAGLMAAVGILHVLKNKELEETAAAFARWFRDTPPIALEPSDVS